jgi:transcriptional regulator with GAF, ATPase, and Fis domain
VAASETRVLTFWGETGTGKELVGARAIHEKSAARREERGASSPSWRGGTAAELIESELFGT